MKLFKQINYYFDTDDFFYYRNNWSCKLRDVSNKTFFILKQETKKELNRREADEYQLEISTEEKDKFVLFGVLPNNVQDLISKLYLKKDIRFLGCLQTNRYCYEMNEFTIFLDENIYLEKKDYEVEIEMLNNNSKVSIPSWLKQILVGESKSKYRRFTDLFTNGKRGDLIRVQVSGIVKNSQDEVLFIRKNKPSSSIHNKLIPPGGHVEFGETPDKAVIREVQEETGLIMVNPILTGIVTFISKEKMEQSVCLFYKGEGEGDLHKKEMHLDSMWVSLEKLESEQDVPIYHKEIIFNSISEEKVSYLTISDEERKL
ncbi:NUDIX domain-containing protein [Ornithinibacillus contaminans]|uniref:NUDIX domain-containing protein n=1 Tax=Ornithinibacillus contaminans TaxID=694055 RepID=UPI00064DAD46|nr:NUDIX domain-containing protein [Ornithinibacillus contaminans]